MRQRSLFVSGVILSLLLPFGSVYGDHTKDHIAKATVDGVKEWADTRGCEVTPDGVHLVVAEMQGTADALKARTAKFALSGREETLIVKGVAQAYLDQASVQQFGPTRKNCVVNAAGLRKVAFPAAANNPDTGILDVDGSERGANIFIDGEKKGNIRQAFILSIGDHTWKTMKCEESVRISPRDTKKVYCDKK